MKNYKIKAKSGNVDAFIKSLDKDKRELAQQLRRIIKKVLPQVVETVKWGTDLHIKG